MLLHIQEAIGPAAVKGARSFAGKALKFRLPTIFAVTYFRCSGGNSRPSCPSGVGGGIFFSIAAIITLPLLNSCLSRPHALPLEIIHATRNGRCGSLAPPSLESSRLIADSARVL